MLKARIARKKRALRATSVQKARKACNLDGGLSEVVDNIKLKLPINDRNNRKGTKTPLIGMGQKGQRLGNSGAIVGQVGQLLVIC
jgi:hypothetical protein